MSRSFAVARRRNEHKRHGAAFLDELWRRTGLGQDSLSLLEPDLSVQLEDEVYPRIGRGIRAGAVYRECGLSLKEATARPEPLLEPFAPLEVAVLLCNSPDFSMTSRLRELAPVLPALVEFDGDTVTICTLDGLAGFAVDSESGPDEARTYEVDAWGSWRGIMGVGDTKEDQR
jgi:hypothetical protein